MTTCGRRIVLLGLLIGASAGCPATTGPVPIYLGHVANSSGADGDGRHAEQGISLALKQLSDDSLAEALQGRPLQVRHADTKGKLDAWESEAVRLVNVNRVIGLIGGTTSEEISRLERGHVPVLAAAGVRPAGTGDMIFALGMRPAQQAFILAKHAAEVLACSDIVILADERRDEYLSVADSFGRQFAEARKAQGKGEVTISVRFGKDAKWDDLAKMLVARKSLGAVFFAGKARDWLEMRRAQRLSLPLIFAGDDGDVAGLQGPEAAETIYFATAFAPDKEVPACQDFIRKYREAFKEDPDVAAALAFESLGIFADAVKRADPAYPPEKLRDALREVKQFSGIGGTLNVTDDQYVRRTLWMVRAAGNAVEVLRRHDASSLP